MILRESDSKQQWPYHPWPARRGAALVQWSDGERQRNSPIASRMIWMLVATALVSLCVTVLTGFAVARLHRDHLGSHAPTVSPHVYGSKMATELPDCHQS
jgi:hypothetical protein